MAWVILHLNKSTKHIPLASLNNIVHMCTPMRALIGEFEQILNTIIHRISVFMMDYFSRQDKILRMVYIPNIMRPLNIRLTHYCGVIGAVGWWQPKDKIRSPFAAFLNPTSLKIPSLRARSSYPRSNFRRHPANRLICTSTTAKSRQFIKSMISSKFIPAIWAVLGCFHKATIPYRALSLPLYN